MNAVPIRDATSESLDSDETTERVAVRRRIDPGHPPIDAGLSGEADQMAASGAETEVAAVAPRPPSYSQDAALSIEPEWCAALLELDEPTPEMLAAAGGQMIESYREQLQLQVAQLAKHLRERLQEVDRREAQVHARVADLEGDLRASKIWLRDREMEFQHREAELVACIQELECRPSQSTHRRADDEGAEAAKRELAEREELLADLQHNLQRRAEELDNHDAEVGSRETEVTAREQAFSARESALLARHQQVATREHELSLLEQELDRRAHGLLERQQQQAAAEAELEQRRMTLDRDELSLREEQRAWQSRQADCDGLLIGERERLSDEAQRLSQREIELQAALAELDEHVRDLHRECVALATDRQAWNEQRARQRQALEQRQREQESDLENRRLRLDARQEWIERQAEGLEQVRGEVLALHRQSLEMRLLAEQLWAQITGRLTPAEITHSIAQLKLKLSEQYRLEEASLETRKAELLKLGEQMQSQHAELSQLRAGLREWAAARQAEIEQQAAALVEREQTLDEQWERIRQARSEWHAERWQTA